MYIFYALHEKGVRKMQIEIGLALSLLGGLLGVLSFLQSKEKHNSKDAAWRGAVDAKLDIILRMQKDMEEVRSLLTEHEGRIAVVENSAKSAHHRLDEYA